MNKLHENIIKYKFEYIYNLNNNRITDIDGCLLLDGLKEDSNKPANSLSNYIDHTKAKKCIFVEAKGSLNKPKFDKKLQQILKFKNVLKYIQDSTKNQSSFGKDLTESIHKHALNKFTQQIGIIFASYDIPLELKKFILSVNNGITEEIYNNFIFSLFKTDQTYTFITYDNKLTKEEKERLKAINSMSDLREYCNTEIPKSIAPLCYYLEPYDKFKNIYEQYKGFLGILHLDTLIFPYLDIGLDIDSAPELKDYILFKNTNNINHTRKRNKAKSNLIVR
jgi:hypothetical protein